MWHVRGGVIKSDSVFGLTSNKNGVSISCEWNRGGDGQSGLEVNPFR